MKDADDDTELEADLPRGAADGLGALVEARWLGVEELKTPEWRYRNGQQPNSGILLGYRRLDQSDDRDYGIGLRDNQHVLTVAGSRCWPRARRFGSAFRKSGCRFSVRKRD